MRVIEADLIQKTVYELCIEACCILPDDVVTALRCARSLEQEGSVAYAILSDIISNSDLARARMRPCCQDTGVAIVFIDIGEDVFINGSLNDAVNNGVRASYQDGCFRKSVLDPISRQNTHDNTPAIIHLRSVKGNSVKVTVAPKGFGSENMTKLYMLKPSDGVAGVIDAIVNTVTIAGACTCPPGVVGVGIGGTSEMACLTAKRQLLRKIGSKATTPELCAIEAEALARINATGIGPMGLGGRTTALAVHAGSEFTHIAGLPVAVNMQCHASRHAERTL